MAQVARPDADVSAGAYTPTPSSPATLFDKVDEAVADDADFFSSELAPTSSVAIIGLQSLSDPLSSVDHVLSYRYRKDASAGAQINLTVELVQDPEGDSGGLTVIATQTHTDISNTWTQNDYTLSGAEADAITDYSDLGVRITANQV